MINSPKNKTNFFVAVFLVAGWVSGCGSTIHATQVYRESPVEVYLAHNVGKDGSPLDAGYQHPFELSPAEAFKIIRSVQVRTEPGRIQKFIARSQNETGPAFSEEDAALLAGGLSKALAAATPADRIHFQINHPDPFHGGNLSTGVLFVKGDRIQLIIQNLRYAPGAGLYDQKGRFREPEKVPYGQKLTIIPGPNQEPGPTKEKKLLSRWVSIDPAGLLSSAPEPKIDVSSGEALDDAELEEKLAKLKGWRERGLITDEVYKEKQEELLKGF